MNKIKLLKNEVFIIIKGIKLINEYLGKGYLFLKTIVSSLRILTPYISIKMSGRIITCLIEKVDYEIILKYVLITVFSTLFLDVVSRTANRNCLIMLNSCWYKHEALLSKKSLSLDFEKVESAKISSLRANVSENARNNGTGVIWLAECLGNLISNLLSLIIAFVMLSGIFKTLSSEINSHFVTTKEYTIIFVAILIFFIITTIFANNKNTKQIFCENNKISSTYPFFEYYYEKVLNENESGKDIRIFNEKELILEELNKSIFKPFKKSKEKIFKSESTYGAISIIATSLIGGIVYLFVGFKALCGVYEVGSVVEYYGVITKFVYSLSSIATEIGFLKNNNLYLRQELEYLNLTSDMKNGTKTLKDIDLRKIEFEFHNVSFKYQGSNDYAIKNLSFKISNKERIAVVGKNGSGKTTMIKLLCRLYDPISGSITLNGIDIREFDTNEYLKLFSIVFQDFKLLAFSVGENIACTEQYDKSRVWKALEMVGLKNRIEKFPKKLNQPIYTLYEKDGVDISGGEEQKIAIARALYKNAPFVILDEPTSSLDPIAESEIYTNFDRIVENKTTVYISHRLSSCVFCDKIIVFDKGTVVQEGTHDRLLTELTGLYNELWNAQAKHYMLK